MVVSEILDTNMTFFFRPKRQKIPIPRTNYAVTYATARGHLTKLRAPNRTSPFASDFSPADSGIATTLKTVTSLNKEARRLHFPFF